MRGVNTMAEKALYVLAGYDDDTEKLLSEIQNKLYEQGFSGIQTKGIPMHFTMGSYNTSREEELRKRIRIIADTHKPFRVEFNHVGLFRLPENDVLFVAPEVSREMLLLKDEFMDSEDEFGWSAHTTMLIDKREVIEKATQIVLDELPIPSGTVTSLHLFEFWPARHIMSVQFNE